jgi:hypothetical protein
VEIKKADSQSKLPDATDESQRPIDKLRAMLLKKVVSVYLINTRRLLTDYQFKPSPVTLPAALHTPPSR